MPESLEKITERLAGIEDRLSRLESGRQAEKIISQVKTQASVSPSTETSRPVGSIIALVIGGLILWTSLPSFLTRFFYRDSYSSYGGSYFDFGSLLFIGLGGFLLALGVKGITSLRNRRSASLSKISAPGTTINVTTPLAVSASQTKEISPEKDKTDSIEYIIASHWFSIVGIIAILLGVVFFLKYAFDNNLVGPIGQVAIGLTFGIALLFAGDLFRTKYQQYSQIITGGGIGVLYLSLWASFGVFHLVGAITVLSAMSLVTVVAALLSVRYNAIYVAALGVIGGFATPVALSSGFEDQMLLMSYVVILNLGVLFIAFFKNWKALNILTFVGTYLVFTVWYGSHYDPAKFIVTFVFLTMLFVIFSFIWIIYNLIYDKKIEETDILLMVFNAAVYFGYSYLLLSLNYKDYLGFFSFALSVYYFIFGSVAYTKFKAESALTLGFLGISVIFLTVAVPLQVERNLITLVWVVEGAVLVWLGFWLNSYKLRVAAMLVYVLVAIRLIAFDSNVPLSEFELILNRRFLTYIAAAISAGVASWLYVLYKSRVQEEEHVILPALLIGLNVILVAALTLESLSFFDAKISKLNERLYESEVSTVVLGQQTITKPVEIPTNDNSVGCSANINQALLLGVDMSCTPPKNVITKLVFTNLPIRPNASITSAYINFMPIDDIADSARYKIVLGNTRNTLISAPIEWYLLTSKKELMLYTTNFNSALQNLVSDGNWQVGDSLVVTIEPATVAVQSSHKMYSYELDSTKAARLTVIYNSTDTGGVQVQHYNPNSNSNNYRNNLSQKSPYQKPYVAPQIDVKVQAEIKTLKGARDFSISAIWLLYSLTLLIIGVIAKYKPIRLSALVFFAVTILKVFLIDSANLQQIYRIIAFIGLGTILLVVAYIYQRFKQQINAFLLNG